MRKTLITVALLLAFIPVHQASSGTAPLEVFVSIAPQKWLSDAIGGHLTNTHVLIDKGQEPHTFEPSPRQLVNLSRAHLYFTIDLPFERRISDKLAQTVSSLQIVNVADNVEKVPIAAHREADAEEGGDEHGHGHDEELDPHIWLSPLNLITIAEDMAQALVRTDPANSSVYQSNLESLKTRLEQLHRRIQTRLKPYAGASIYVFHPAFGYFTAAYGLIQEAVETGGKSPSPRQLAHIVTAARADGIRVIFVQPQFDPKSAAAVAAAIDGRVVPLDPLSADIYGMIEEMSEAIVEALRGQGH